MDQTNLSKSISNKDKAIKKRDPDSHWNFKLHLRLVVAGASLLTFLLARENISLILAAPLFSLSVNSAPEAKTKGNPLCFASVLAKSVFPVPGGPESRTPCNLVFHQTTYLVLYVTWNVSLKTMTGYANIKYFTRTNFTSFS